MTNAAQQETIFTLPIDAHDITVRYRPYYIKGSALTRSSNSRARTNRAAAFP
jgi:hypothetical protein